MLVKFASAEAQVLGFKGAPSQLRTASLSKFGEYSDYRTDDNYLYVRVRAISSRVNKNHDGWPSEELQKSWRTFIGKPIFVDHHNSEPSKARGVVVDAALHVEDDFEKASSLDPYYATAPDNHKPPTWVELLLEVDAKTFPKLAQAIIDGDIDGVSMGCNVERSKCSVCSNWARSPEEYCKHIVSKGAYFDHKQGDGTKVSKKSYEDCYDIGFFEISFVFDPADETALVRDLKTARTSSVKKDVYHEAGLFDGDPGGSYGDPNSIDMQQYPAGELFGPQGAQEQNLAPGQMVPGPTENDFRLISMLGGDQQLAQTVSLQYQTALANSNDPVTAAHMVGQILLRHGFHNDVVSGVLDELVENSAVPTDNLPYQEMPFGLDNQLPHNMNNPMLSKTAERNPPPQSDEISMPEKVDTLRKEQICPVCGSDMDDGTCEVCNYVEPPEGFDNPDLDKAKEREQAQQAPVAPDAPPNPLETPGGEQGPSGPPSTSAPPGGGAGGGQMPMAASYKSNKTNGVTTDMGTWKVVTKTASGNNSGGRINTQERPILPASRQNSDKASGARVVKDSLKPVESNDKETRMDQTHKVADGVGATPAGEGVSADKRVDPTGVGAVDNSPEKNTQHVNVEKEVSIDGTPTDTWHGNEGDSLGQHEPVTNDVGSGGMTAPIGQPVSHTHTSDAWGSPGEGSGKAFPDHDPARIDVTAPLLEERGDPTKTFGGDDFHLTDPVTNELGSGGMSAPIGEQAPTEGLSPKSDDSLKRSHSLRSHIFRAMKLAEVEVDLGITSGEAKWQRAAELEEQTPVQLDSVEQTLARVKTAGLHKQASTPIQKKAHSLPSFQAPPVTQTEVTASGDEQLFIR